MNVDAALLQPLDAFGGIYESVLLAGFGQGLTEDLQDAIDRLGGQGFVAAPAFALGELGSEAEDLGLGDSADLHLAEERREVTIKRGPDGGAVGISPSRQGRCEPLFYKGMEEGRVGRCRGAFGRDVIGRRGPVASKLCRKLAAGKEIGVVEGAGRNGLLNLVERLLHALAVGGRVLELGVLAAARTPVAEIEE